MNNFPRHTLMQPSSRVSSREQFSQKTPAWGPISSRPQGTVQQLLEAAGEDAGREAADEAPKEAGASAPHLGQNHQQGGGNQRELSARARKERSRKLRDLRGRGRAPETAASAASASGTVVARAAVLTSPSIPLQKGRLGLTGLGRYTKGRSASTSSSEASLCSGDGGNQSRTTPGNRKMSSDSCDSSSSSSSSRRSGGTTQAQHVVESKKKGNKKGGRSPAAAASAAAAAPDEDNMSRAERIEARRLRNRESAALSRKRNRDHITTLEDRVVGLTVRVGELEDENAHLRRFVRSRGMDPCVEEQQLQDEDRRRTVTWGATDEEHEEEQEEEHRHLNQRQSQQGQGSSSNSCRTAAKARRRAQQHGARTDSEKGQMLPSC